MVINYEGEKYNLNTINGRYLFIKRAASGVYTLSNKGHENFTITVVQGESLHVKVLHNCRGVVSRKRSLSFDRTGHYNK